MGCGNYWDIFSRNNYQFFFDNWNYIEYNDVEVALVRIPDRNLSNLGRTNCNK